MHHLYEKSLSSVGPIFWVKNSRHSVNAWVEANWTRNSVNGDLGV